MKLNISDYFDKALYKKCFYFLEYDPEMFLFVNNKGELSIFCTSSKQASYFQALFERSVFRTLLIQSFGGFSKRKVIASNKVDEPIFTFQNVKFGFEYIESENEQDLLDFQDKIIRPMSASSFRRRTDEHGNKIDGPNIPVMIDDLLLSGYKLSDDFFSSLPIKIPEFD